MALLPARNILDGTALPVTSQMKTALGSLRDYCSDLLGTDSSNKAAARTALGAAASGANTDITSLTGLTTPLSMAQGGTGMANGFVSVKAASGYQKLPSGLIIQWGASTLSTAGGLTFASASLIYPLAFTTAVHQVFATLSTPASNQSIGIAAASASLSQASVFMNSTSAITNQPFSWLAIGY